MDAFFQQLGRVDDAAAALPEMPIPRGALDDGADLDVVARQDLQRQLDDLAAEGHRKKNMKTLADLVEAGLDNTESFPRDSAYHLSRRFTNDVPSFRQPFQVRGTFATVAS